MRFLVGGIFLAPILLAGCSGFSQGYTQARQHPIRSYSLEQVAEYRARAGLRDSDYYAQQRLINAIKDSR